MLSQNQIKERILNYVASHPGCTDVQLAVNSNVIEDNHDGGHSLDIPFLIEGWVDKAELIEVEYTTPHAPYRTNSLYFAKDSDVSLSRIQSGTDIILNGKRIKRLPANTTTNLRGVLACW